VQEENLYHQSYTLYYKIFSQKLNNFFQR